jgi:predicted nucleic acid-binding Zn finger protein
MTSTTRKPRAVRPPACRVVTFRRAAYPCELLPAGQVALVSVNEKGYAVSVAGGVVTFHTAEGKRYQVCGDTCTCPDYVYTREPRGEVCKHCLAAKLLAADGTI